MNPGTTFSKHFGIEADAFSYPNGNYNESIIDMVKQNGYGWVSEYKMDMFGSEIIRTPYIGLVYTKI